MSTNEWDEYKRLVNPLKEKNIRFVQKKTNLVKSNQKKFDNSESIDDLDIMVSESWGNLEKNILKNILKGKIKISATLDLHGYNLNDSKRMVLEFINNNHKLQNRLLLLISGKGKRLSVNQGWKGIGKLRANIPLWLNSLALSDKVLWFDYAPQSKGGQGAFLIYLKKL